MKNISIIILTYNEEKNISQCLNSVCSWADQVFILDSYSTDSTCDIAKKYNCDVYQNRFKGYPQQRNWALDNLPIETEWIFFLDADEWVSEELKKEILNKLVKSPKENGFYIKRRFIWMGKWIKRGYYPTWILRLFRYGQSRCEERPINEHFIVEGEVGFLKNDFIHEDRRGVDDWIEKHNRYATKEAIELIKEKSKDKYADARFFGTQSERKRWIRYKIWNRMPPLIRPFFYFFYRYIFKGGFMDGKEAFIYHFLQGLWFPFLIDVKYLEIKCKNLSKKIL